MTLFRSGLFMLVALGVLPGCVTKKVHAQVMKHHVLTVHGGYHPQEVGLHFRKIHPALKACHQQYGFPTGRLVFQYEIRPADGGVMNVKLLDDVGVIKQDHFRTCAVKAVEGLKYDKMAAGSNSSIIYPVAFPLTQ